VQLPKRGAPSLPAKGLFDIVMMFGLDALCSAWEEAPLLDQALLLQTLTNCLGDSVDSIRTVAVEGTIQPHVEAVRFFLEW
jgi:hypothetical protein